MQAKIGQRGPDNSKLTMGDMDKLMRMSASGHSLALMTSMANVWMRDRNEPLGISQAEIEIVCKRNNIRYRR